MINSYAKEKCQINNLAKQGSMMVSWKPVTKGEVPQYFVITIAVGLQVEP